MIGGGVVGFSLALEGFTAKEEGRSPYTERVEGRRPRKLRRAEEEEGRGRGGRYERGEWKVPVPGLSWYTETPERRLTLLNNERAEAPKDPGPRDAS